MADLWITKAQQQDDEFETPRVQGHQCVLLGGYDAREYVFIASGRAVSHQVGRNVCVGFHQGLAEKLTTTLVFVCVCVFLLASLCVQMRLCQLSFCSEAVAMMSTVTPC